MAELHKKTRVVTADGQKLGEALRIYRNPREEEINPELKLFEFYLYVLNLDLPDDYFIPLDYLAGYDEKTREARLKISMRKVEKELLTRKPQFIAIGQAVEEPLPE